MRSGVLGPRRWPVPCRRTGSRANSARGLYRQKAASRCACPAPTAPSASRGFPPARGRRLVVDLSKLECARVRRGRRWRRRALTAGGAAKDLAMPAKRRLTFELTGRAGGLTRPERRRPRPGARRGARPRGGRKLAGRQPGRRRHDDADRRMPRHRPFVGGSTATRSTAPIPSPAPDLSVFAGLVGQRDCRSASTVGAKGNVALIGGAFSLGPRRHAKDLETGMATVDPMPRRTARASPAG